MKAFKIFCIHCDRWTNDWVFRGFGVYVCSQCSARQKKEQTK